MAAAVCVVASRGSERESGERFNEFPGRQERASTWKWYLTGAPGHVSGETGRMRLTVGQIYSVSVGHSHLQGEKKDPKQQYLNINLNHTWTSQVLASSGENSVFMSCNIFIICMHFFILFIYILSVVLVTTVLTQQYHFSIMSHYGRNFIIIIKIYKTLEVGGFKSLFKLVMIWCENNLFMWHYRRKLVTKIIVILLFMLTGLTVMTEGAEEPVWGRFTD